jgi:DNA invertase Pin-like site-specific DNA recombinase
MAGLARAKAEGKRSERRTTVSNDLAEVQAIRADHKAGKSLREIAKTHGVSHMTVARITAGAA